MGLGNSFRPLSQCSFYHRWLVCSFESCSVRSCCSREIWSYGCPKTMEYRAWCWIVGNQLTFCQLHFLSSRECKPSNLALGTFSLSSSTIRPCLQFFFVSCLLGSSTDCCFTLPWNVRSLLIQDHQSRGCEKRFHPSQHSFLSYYRLCCAFVKDMYL